MLCKCKSQFSYKQEVQCLPMVYSQYADHSYHPIQVCHVQQLQHLPLLAVQQQLQQHRHRPAWRIPSARTLLLLLLLLVTGLLRWARCQAVAAASASAAPSAAE
jgi:hypothetical protein